MNNAVYVALNNIAGAAAAAGDQDTESLINQCYQTINYGTQATYDTVATSTYNYIGTNAAGPVLAFASQGPVIYPQGSVAPSWDSLFTQGPNGGPPPNVRNLGA